MTATDGAIADRRVSQRRPAIPGAAVVFDGRTFALRNLSVGGFLCINYQGTRSVGDRFNVKLIAAPDLDCRYDFLLEAEVVRLEPDTKRMAARFTKVRGENASQFKRFFVRHPNPAR